MGERLNKGAKGKLFDYAKQLRKGSTAAEDVLWERIRNRKLSGLKFRRQHPIKNFILDFFCFDLSLGIEVDGDIHLLAEVKEKDEGRTFELNESGIVVIRFTNDEVLNNIDFVLQTIEDFLKERSNPIFS